MYMTIFIRSNLLDTRYTTVKKDVATYPYFPTKRFFVRFYDSSLKYQTVVLK